MFNFNEFIWHIQKLLTTKINSPGSEYKTKVPGNNFYLQFIISHANMLIRVVLV